MAEIKLCVTRARSPGLLSPFGKMGTGFRWLGSSQSLDLKYGCISFADWLRSTIAPVLGLKMITDLPDTNSMHTSIAHVHHTAPHTGDYMGNVRTLCGARGWFTGMKLSLDPNDLGSFPSGAFEFKCVINLGQWLCAYNLP